jgi:microcystin-dependent protein
VSQLINLVTVQNDLSNLQILVNGLFKTGMIMPFMGTVAPSGWMLCDGRSIPDDEEHAALRSLVGNNTPNLNELTIVGAGTRNVGSILGNNEINLSVEQLPAHKHEAGTLKTTEAGNHYHQIAGEIMQKDGSSTKEVAALDTRGDPGFGTYYKNTGSAGNHLHYIDGETASAGSGTAIDIRNPSFAANFIIKI